MKFPNFLSKSTFTARAFVLLVGLLLMVSAASAQKTDAPTAQSAYDLDQCRNGGAPDPPQPCVNSNWVNGNAGASNSQWAETQFLPYRARLTGLSFGPDATAHLYTMVIAYDRYQGTVNAIDYLGTYNTTNPADPCDGGATCSGATSVVAITADPNVASAGVTQVGGQFITMWGGTLHSFAYGAYDGTEQQIILTFTAQVANPVIAWSGHVAWAGDWGAGNSAGGISGSPYHMRIKSLDGTGGNQDRSLSASAVAPAGIIRVIKSVSTQDNSGVAFTSFDFTATAPMSPTSFSIVDNVPGTDGGSFTSQAITSFGSGNQVTIKELNELGWTASDVSCTSNFAGTVVSAGLAPLGSSYASSAIVYVNPGGLVTCTFTNTQVNVTAAPASVSGRVTSIDGTGLRGVSVTLYDISSGTTLRTTTNSFGVYRFSGLDTQDFYRVVVSSRQYTFRTASKSFTLLGDLANLNFVTAE